MDYGFTQATNYMKKQVEAMTTVLNHAQKTTTEIMKNVQEAATQGTKDATEHFQKIAKQPMSTQNLQLNHDYVQNVFQHSMKLASENAAKFFDFFQNSMKTVYEAQEEAKKAVAK